MEQDKNKIAMGVLEEIQQLIQDRIGGGIAPEAPKPSPEELGEPPAESAGEMDLSGGEELSPEESELLAGDYESAGMDDEGAPEELPEGDPRKKKVM